RAIRLALLILLWTSAQVLAQSSSPAPTVSYPENFAVSPPLSDIHQAPAATTLKVRARRPVPLHGAAAGAQHASDQALQTAAGGHLAVRENPNFPGLGENGSIPGDPNIAVGPMHVVQVVN